MMTGTVIGYNSTGSSTSRLRARTSMAANSVPTAREADGPRQQNQRQPHGMREQRRLEEKRHQRNEQDLAASSSATMPSSLPT